jgi:GNAT superfamily N-acetyltransferase
MTETGVEIRELRPGDFGAVAGLLRRLRGDNLYTGRGVRHDVESEPGRAESARWVAERDGIVGYGVAMRLWWRASNDAYAWAGVVPEARGAGVGGALWARVEQHVAALGIGSLVTDVVDDPAGTSFVRSRGFGPNRLDRVSVLDPRAVDLGDLPRLERAAAAGGYSLVPLDSLGDLHAVYELALAVDDDMPGSTAPHAISYGDWEASLLRAPDLDAGASTVVVHHGLPVALALLSVDLESRRARNEETGTARAHRRKGLATLAKLATIRWASEHGIEAILTDNAEANRGMLAINERLGYRPLVARQRWIKLLGG